jgi:GntR family transcriptional regulator, transcriptional repressor for pyruvate dehydrogenase complex
VSATPGPRSEALRPLPRPRLYEQLVEHLLTHVRDEGLRPGDRLPPERELASLLGVSRASVSQALVALEVQGVVDVRHGDGAVLRDVPAQPQIVAALRARRRRLTEVIEAREALEVKLAELAAVRRDEDDLQQLDAALARMADDVVAGGRGEAGDARFHAAVTAAAHSGLLADLMAEIDVAVRESRTESLSQPDRPQRSLDGHRAIAEAIRAGDASAARDAMRAHLALVSDVALLHLDEEWPSGPGSPPRPA